MNKLKFKKNDLYNGCLIGAIAHAIIVGRYPELSYEQSWDGINYNLVGDNGIRGTITFNGEECVAAFRNEKNINDNEIENALSFFEEAPESIKSIAKNETLLYLLEIVNKKKVPLITAGFWSEGENIVTSCSEEEIILNGMSIIEKQIMPIEKSILEWKEYYEMEEEEIELLKIIYKKIKTNNGEEIILSKNEIKILGELEEEGLEELKNSFKEMNIYLEI